MSYRVILCCAEDERESRDLGVGALCDGSWIKLDWKAVMPFPALGLTAVEIPFVIF